MGSVGIKPPSSVSAPRRCGAECYGTWHGGGHVGRRFLNARAGCSARQEPITTLDHRRDIPTPSATGTAHGCPVAGRDEPADPEECPAPGRHDRGVKRVLLLRHAKSSWKDPHLDDRDRPLAPRGRRAVTALARHLRATGSSPDLVVCSSAVRARQTWEGVAPGIPPDVAVEIDDALYGAGAAALLERLTRLPAGVDIVLVIGHNPGLAELAAGLADAGDPSLRARMAAKFPTGALATLDAPGEWRDLTWGRATLADFVVPRDLGR